MNDGDFFVDDYRKLPSGSSVKVGSVESVRRVVPVDPHLNSLENNKVSEKYLNFSIDRDKSVVINAKIKPNNLKKRALVKQILKIIGVGVIVITSATLIGYGIWNLYEYYHTGDDTFGDSSQSSFISIGDTSSNFESSPDGSSIIESDDKSDSVLEESFEDEESEEIEVSDGYTSDMDVESIDSNSSDFSESGMDYEESDEYSSWADEKISSNTVSNVVFEVGTSIDIDDTREFLDATYAGSLISQYSDIYGVDPKIVAAICYQESGGVNLIDDGAARGIMRLENMPPYDLRVYNFKDDCYETLTVDSNYTYDLEYNIRCGIANLRNKIDYCKGNIYAALQAYNYNEITFMKALEKNGYVLDGYTDYGWLPITEDVTNNPWKYGIDGYDDGYGVSYYPNSTGIHLIDKIVNYKYVDKDNNSIEEITINYETAEVLSVEKIGNALNVL